MEWLDTDREVRRPMYLCNNLWGQVQPRLFNYDSGLKNLRPEIRRSLSNLNLIRNHTRWMRVDTIGIPFEIYPSEHLLDAIFS